MPKRIAVYGGSLNPPGTHHRIIAEAVAALRGALAFDEVVVVPCGPRPDKPTTNDIEPVHRAVMVDMTFRGLAKVSVDLFDLENDIFTRSHELEARFAADGGEVWHVVGADLIAGGAKGESPIQQKWTRGGELWSSGKFVVARRDGFPMDAADLPPQHHVLEVTCPRATDGVVGASADLRTMIFGRRSVAGLVTDEVDAYIERYNLYRGGIPVKIPLRFDPPRALIVADTRNPRAVALAERFGSFAADEAVANCILAIGGDGTMLRAIRTHWRKRLPFIGVNAGHRGYLLNGGVEAFEDAHYLFENLMAHQLPQLYVQFKFPDGTWRGHYAFNDAWLERETGQCAWLEVKSGGRVRIAKLVADGALVCTSAGSTAYARAMGSTPFISTDQYSVVASNALIPREWSSAPSPIDWETEITSLDSDKRPIRAMVDGRELGRVTAMRVRASRIADVELAFTPGNDMAAKLAEDMYPQ